MRRLGFAATAATALALQLAAGASAGEPRIVYVSNGLGAGSQTVSALRIGANGQLTPVAAPIASGGTTNTEGIAITPDAKHVYVALFTENAVAGFNVQPNGSLVSAGAPFTTGFTMPLGVAPDPDGEFLFAWNHGDEVAVSRVNANGTLTNIVGSPFTVPGSNTNPFGGSVHPSGNFLYTPYENAGGAHEEVGAWTVAGNGTLNEIQSIDSGDLAVNDTNPFGSAVTPDGRFLFVSNPEDGANGTVSSFSINQNNGILTPVVQALNVSPANHPLNMAVSPDGTHLYVASRISASINAYSIGVNGTLTPIAGQPFATGATSGAAGAGKAIAITPGGERLYLSAGDTNDAVFGFNVAPNGALTPIPGSPTPTGGTEPDLEAIVITPNQGPTGSFSVQAGFVGQPTTFNGFGSLDPDGNIERYDWSFGDGATQANGGPTLTHTYTAAGSYTATLTVTDDEGCSNNRIFTGKATLCNANGAATTSRQVVVQVAPPDPVDTTAPVFLSSAIDPSRFAVDKAGTPEAPVALAQKGTTFRYSLDEAARVTFTVVRKLPGRLVRGTCVRKTKSNKKRRRCTRFKTVGAFAQDAVSGDNTKPFSGKIGGRSLAPGRYRATLIATDAAGNASVPSVLNFRVTKK